MTSFPFAFSALQEENIRLCLELKARFWTTTCETASYQCVLNAEAVQWMCSEWLDIAERGHELKQPMEQRNPTLGTSKSLYQETYEKWF